jgi:hypothetical protein
VTVTGRIILLFVVLTVIATWPQAIRFNAVPDNVDSYFSLWRLGWIAHQLVQAPARLFDGNIFHPESNTLAYSDAILLLGAAGLPFVQAGVPIVYVYNALVLGSFVAAALGMFVLVRHLTSSPIAAVLSGVVFAFASYRYDHYFHLELLWSAWMPLAFWMVHRTLESGRLAHGLAVGLFVLLQILSSIYYGVFLGSGLVILGIVLLPSRPRELQRKALMALSAGALLAAVLALPYLLPYSRARAVVGERNKGEALLHAAGPKHYLAVMPDNRLEGSWLGSLGRHEKRLFPGFVALALGLVAMWPPVSRTRIAYAVVLILAVNLSFGPRGLGFEWLREHVFLYRGIRAPARVGQVALLVSGVLAGMGCARLHAWLSARRLPANAVVAALIVIAFAEYLVKPLELVSVPTRTPPAYEWLRTQPRGVVAEFPMPTKQTSPLLEGEFQFLSTFHWYPLVNGYSGNWSKRHVGFLERVQKFPDEAAIAALREAGVEYVLVHERYLGRDHYAETVARLDTRLTAAGRFPGDGYEIAAYLMR